jgi:hypothetical protein
MLPDDTIIVRTYAQLSLYLRRFAEGQLGLLLLLGRPGTGKTHHAKQALGLGPACVDPESEPALYIEGHVQAFGLYQKLWQCRDQPVVLDDLDRLYADPNCVRLLKPLCNGQRQKTISWITNATREGGDVPDHFTTTSHVALIANEWRTLNANVRALEDRAIILLFDPPNTEVHQKAREWFKDVEVFTFIEHWVGQVPALSLRHYEKGARLRQAGFVDWQESLKRMMRPDVRLLAIAQLRTDPVLHTEEARIQQFCKQTGCSRATYFRLRSRVYT